MIILQANNISKSFGAEPILTNIKLEVQDKDRIALVGRNGAGKSTLLNILAGITTADSGQIIKPKEVTIGYLTQHTNFTSNASIWDEMLKIFTYLQKMEQHLRALELKMGDPDLISNNIKYEQLLKEYDTLQLNFKEQGGYQYEANIRSVLYGLNFPDPSILVSELSGGQRTRFALGKLLLTKPHLLILDEPTNHLDIETLTWLENYLQNYTGAILIVSHDRYFLDKVVTQVYEISRKTAKKFIGNYSRYLSIRAEQYEQDTKLYERQQDEVANLKDFIQKNIVRASTAKQAQSRRKKLEKMELLDRPLGDEKSASFQFMIEKQSGNEVLICDNVAVSYDDIQPTIQHVNARITRSESIALIGRNGIGKSTLLKAIVEKLPLFTGSFKLGANVQVSYYDQIQANLSSNKRVLNELWDIHPLTNEKEIRTVLGNFLFSGDDVLKPVSSLSGGEKARLSLAKLMMEKGNFLILDEPTNHLDLDSKEILENALIDYPGTILFVSHDRYFINRLATKVYDLSESGVTEYLGNYDYYIEKKAEMMEIEKLNAPQLVETGKTNLSTYEQEKETKKLERQRKRRVEELEQLIHELEKQLADNEQLLCEPTVYNDYERVQQINEENKEAEQKLLLLMDEWESLL